MTSNFNIGQGVPAPIEPSLARPEVDLQLDLEVSALSTPSG